MSGREFLDTNGSGCGAAFPPPGGAGTAGGAPGGAVPRASGARDRNRPPRDAQSSLVSARNCRASAYPGSSAAPTQKSASVA